MASKKVTNAPCAKKYTKPTKEQKEQNEYFTLHAGLVYSLLPIIEAGDRIMVKKWLQLLGTMRDSNEERTIRNDYIWLLLVQLESGVVTLPFIKTPPRKLKPVAEMLDKKVYIKIMTAANKRIKESEPQIDMPAGSGTKPSQSNRSRPSEFLRALPRPQCGLIAYGSCFSDQLH